MKALQIASVLDALERERGPGHMKLPEGDLSSPVERIFAAGRPFGRANRRAAPPRGILEGRESGS